MMNNFTKLKRIENVVIRKIADETLLVPINQTGADLQKVYVLNETGVELWESLDIPKSMAEIVDNLCTIYDAEGEKIARDIAPVVKELLHQGLLFSDSKKE
jgi:hypothetical protein